MKRRKKNLMQMTKKCIIKKTLTYLTSYHSISLLIMREQKVPARRRGGGGATRGGKISKNPHPRSENYGIKSNSRPLDIR